MKNIIRIILIFMLIPISVILSQNIKSMSFDGVDDYVTLGNSWDLKPSAALTIEFWANNEDWTPAISQKFISNTQLGGYSLAIFNMDEVWFHLHVGGDYRILTYPTTNLTPGWHHFAGTFDGRYVKLYIDGDLKVTDDLGTSGNLVHYEYSNSTLIGTDAHTGDTPEGWGFYNGQIDELRIWNYARSKTQINRAKHTIIPSGQEGLLARYDMEGNTQSAIYDRSGNNKTGYVRNGGFKTISGDYKFMDKPSFVSSGYSITGKDDLYWLVHAPDFWDQKFTMINDIEFSEADFAAGGDFYEDGKGFLPIGTKEVAFTGEFNGYSKKIENVFISHPTNYNSYMGFFGKINGAIVKRLRVENINVNAGNSTYVGGLVGMASNESTIDQCSATGNVTGFYEVGGLVGTLTGNCTIENSFSKVSVNAKNFTGGFVGVLSASTIRNSYTIGELNVQSNYPQTGGFVGQAINSTIESSYLALAVNIQYASNKGFVGYNAGLTTNNNFFDKEYSSQSSGAGATAKTTNELKDFKTYIDISTDGLSSAWDFFGKSFDDESSEELWDMDQLETVNNGYPILHWQEGADQALFIYDFPGSGSITQPFIISTLDHLKSLSQNEFYWDKYFKQYQNIDASETSTWDEGKGFSPIGNENTPFEGTYDGNKHTISNLSINRPGESSTGFFGLTGDYAKIMKLGITDAKVIGDRSVGILGGDFSSSTVSSVTECFVIGDVEGNDCVGALVGKNKATISKSFSQGSVTRLAGEEQSFGGFCGNNSGIISESYSAVVVNESKGNFWGANEETDANKGFVGIDESGQYLNSFFDKEISSQKSGEGASGKTTEEMKAKSTYAVSFWSFIPDFTYSYSWGTETRIDPTWGLNPNVNAGYPFLTWQPYREQESYVKSREAEDVFYFTAKLTADVIYVGELPITGFGFCWNTTGEPKIADTHIEFTESEDSTKFSANISGLSADTDYFYRSFIKTDLGIQYSVERSFTTGPAPPFSGSGTIRDPFLIGTPEDMQNLAGDSEFFDKHFALTQDIDMTGISIYTIGFPTNFTNGRHFTGTFDGRGKTITGLTMSNNLSDNQALFGVTNGAEIKNLNLVNINISGKSTVAGLVATALNTTVYNCSVKGSIRGDGDYLGGLIASAFNSKIIDSHTEISVSASEVVRIPYMVGWEIRYRYETRYFGNIGGLIGQADNSIIKNCFSDGSASGAGNTGGFIGYSEDSDISNNYSGVEIFIGSKSTSSSSNSSANAAFIGYSINSTIGCCYATGKMKSNGNGFVGIDYNSEFNGNFFDTETTLKLTGIGATPKTSEELKIETTFLDANWDFVNETKNGLKNVWAINENLNSGYPFLTNQRFFGVRLPVQNITRSRKIISYMNIGFTAQNDGESISLDFEEINETPPNIFQNAKTIGKYWDVGNISGGKIKITLCYDSSLTAGFDGTPTIYHYDGSSWIALPTSEETMVDSQLCVETLNYYSSFSPVTVGDISAPLPVELVTFAAKKVKNQIQLNWKTATELDNYGFEIERKELTGLEKTNWEKIGFVKGRGNSNTTTSYSFADISPLNNVLEYRLKQIDFNGAYEYSERIEIDNKFIPNEYALSQNYPNPFNPTTIITFQVPRESKVNLVIFNMLGEIVKVLVDEEKSPGEYKINWNGRNSVGEPVSSGMYFYRMQSGDFTAIHKMMLLR
ncbi:MAG: T9SS type A sorting domain-containing protein [Melioribacteraceae bacterium]|nr:T9SS type A sorting domain-containing protein [Melioribacteraceae bacterium]MCF8263132.1 T9SS type A sorting domain-containing protein [Melioribacteraceae bacterium]MCF8430362.1 T9SS type A sorting domain-containing protein [Melioribacteraceae bacterium]